MRKALRPAALGLAGLFIAVSGAAFSPAFADVKAGVDAWSRGEYRKAVEEWRPAAIAGDADAQFNLGQAYKLGRGVPVDMAMAESWYRKAALQGQIEAEANYGLILFQNGKREEALPWLNKAVARGEPRAQLVLGTMLYNGDGVMRDWPRAYALIVRSAVQVNGDLLQHAKKLRVIGRAGVGVDNQPRARHVRHDPAPRLEDRGRNL